MADLKTMPDLKAKSGLLFRILSALGSLIRSKEDEELMHLVNNSWRTLRVVGRGTLTVDPEEIANSPEYKDALRRMEPLVKKQR